MNNEKQSDICNFEDRNAVKDDALISSLFKIKSETEVPSEDFWKNFDKQFERKLQQHQTAKSNSTLAVFKNIYNNIIEYKKAILQYASGFACCGFLLFSFSKHFISQPENTAITALNAISYNETFAMNELESSQVWQDTTIRLNPVNHSKITRTYNDLCLSKGTSCNAEFLF